MESLTYAARAEFLASLGWASYDEYLRSSLWAAIGRRVKAGRLCCCGCRRPAGQVHHAAYTRENLLGHSLEGLLPIAAVCHAAIERDGKGNKRSLGEANAALASRAARNAAGTRPPPRRPGPPGIAAGTPAPLYGRRKR